MSGVGLWLTAWLTDYANGHLAFDQSQHGGAAVRFSFDSATYLGSLIPMSSSIERVCAPT